MISVSLRNMKLSSNLITFCAKNYAFGHTKHAKRTIRLNSRAFASTDAVVRSDDHLKAYVAHPYSYAYGRSNKQLEYLRIGDLLDRQVQAKSDRIAVASDYEDIIKSFGELNEDVNKLAKGLYELGLRRGDVVGLWSCNSYSWIRAQYACARLGVILCTVNPVYRGPELNYALRKGQIKALLMPGVGSRQEVVNKYQKVFLEGLQFEDQKETDEIILKDVILLDGTIPSERTKHDLKFHTIESLVSNDGKVDATAMEVVSPDDPAMIMFTSGTTGKPKGAYLSHFTLVNNTLLTAKAFGTPGEEMSMCIPLPFFHAFAGVLGNISMSAHPFRAVIPNFKYDVKLIVASIIKHNCTHIIVTPTQVIDILNYVERNGVRITSLKGTLIGGAPVPVEVAHRINQIIPSCDDVRIGYGATEIGPCTTACHQDDTFEQKLESVGSPLDFVEVKIVNPTTGVITKIGEQGELLARGHQVMIGYWRDEVKTKESITPEKWYKSGDLAIMDEEGFLKIVGRTKEMIIRGGENIYPREVEELLHRHPEVFDAYVVGVPDERYGEEVCAWIQLKNKETKVTTEEIREFCKQNISYFKVPRYVLFVDGFPMTPTGKAQKFIMRDKSCEILGLKEHKR